MTRDRADSKKKKAAYEHLVDSERCKGCGLCVSVCPKEVLEISDKVNTKGYFPVYRARPEDCIYCAMCAVMCPDVAITIREIVEDAAEAS
jgi:2-oxoglutarate ferredoxin oxidoreductase subunit delta